MVIFRRNTNIKLTPLPHGLFVTNVAPIVWFVIVVAVTFSLRPLVGFIRNCANPTAQKVNAHALHPIRISAPQ